MNGRTRVGIHQFHTYKQHGGRDGANFAYSELGCLLHASPRIELVPHDIVRLFEDDRAAKQALAGCAVVVATVGPHAYLYFYLRERLGLDYRIVRDVRTALWNGYLLQESLVAPYLQPEDSIIYSSAYSRDLFRLCFPYVPVKTQHICYPLLHWFPPQEIFRARTCSSSGTFTIGFVGRLTDDKNFSQALDLIAALNKKQPGRFKLVAVGEGKASYKDAAAMCDRLGLTPQAYTWVKPVSHTQIWDYYNSFDLVFFPSTSSLETFGRVLVEATYAGVPVLASAHAAASELLDSDALLPTHYFRQHFTAHLAARLGNVDIEAAANRIITSPPIALSKGYLNYCDDAARFIDLVCAGNEVNVGRSRMGTPVQGDFIARVTAHDLPSYLQMEETDRLIEYLRPRFVALHSRLSPAYLLAMGELLTHSRYRHKTLQFIKRSLFQGEDFTNIGGVDLQFSHLLRFYPSFEIQ